MKKNTIKELRKEATKWAKKNQSVGVFSPFPNRSCWHCNGAHSHFKKSQTPFMCFSCGHIYLKGKKLTDGKIVTGSFFGLE